jgi:pimeloyl-ACP methyl ester carboxylesterase
MTFACRDNPEGANAKAQQRTFARSRKVVLEGAGHACYLDAPDVFHSELAAWMVDIDHQAPASGITF